MSYTHYYNVSSTRGLTGVIVSDHMLTTAEVKKHLSHWHGIKTRCVVAGDITDPCWWLVDADSTAQTAQQAEQQGTEIYTVMRIIPQFILE